jgi:hypothetical protein
MRERRRCGQFDFQVLGLTADLPGDEELHYFVQILACDLESGKVTVLAAGHQRLVSNLHTYTVRLEFPTPGAWALPTCGLGSAPGQRQSWGHAWRRIERAAVMDAVSARH